MKERLMAYIDYLGVSVHSFEMQAGLSRGTINSLDKGIRSDKLASLLMAFPELNPDFLLGLSSTMLREETPSDSCNLASLNAEIDHLRKELSDTQTNCATLLRAIDILTKQ